MVDYKKNETPLVFWTKTLTGEYHCPFCNQKHLGTFDYSDIKAERICNNCHKNFWVYLPTSKITWAECLESKI